MRIRFILAMLIGLAMGLGPLAMAAAAAAPAAPAHHASMTAMDHCDGQQPAPDHRTPVDKNCCVAGCMALAALPPPGLDQPLPAASRARPAPDQFYQGFLAEIATPPPRRV